MQYKLTPEQIREKAKSIAIQVGSGEWQTNAILTLIEEATGEKIPEPVDESNVKHGSVWVMPREQSTGVVLFEDGNGEWIGIYTNGFPSEFDFRGGNKDKIIGGLKSRNYTHYLGQFSIIAGLPKQ